MYHEWVEILVAWITAAGIFLLSTIYPLRLYCQNKKLSPEHLVFRTNHFLRKAHKPLGVLIIPLTFLHCRLSSQKLGLNIGTVLLFILILLLLTYLLRKQMKGKWMILHRKLTAVLWFLLIAHIVIDTERFSNIWYQICRLSCMLK